MSEIIHISGGVHEVCYSAYQSMRENKTIPELFINLFYFMPYGAIKMALDAYKVKKVCGSWAAFGEAKEAYCAANPIRCKIL